MALHDGNGWVHCRCGRRHWGLHGAAGLLVVGPHPQDRDPQGRDARVLLQLRAGWTHQGGTWALPGGARDSHEGAVDAALREAEEEVGVTGADLRVLAEVAGVDHGDWRYTYVLALATRPIDLAVRTAETDELRWVGLAGVDALPLHPGFASTWPALRPAVEQAVADQVRG